MLDEEIYVLTRHGRFEASYIETIPVYKRRHFLFLLEREVEKMEEYADKSKGGSYTNNIPQRPR